MQGLHPAFSSLFLGFENVVKYSLPCPPFIANFKVYTFLMHSLYQKRGSNLETEWISEKNRVLGVYLKACL